MSEKHEEYISKSRNQLVVKSNAIVRTAKYDLNIYELKAFAYVVSMIRPDDDYNKSYTFKIKDYCEILGLDPRSGGNYSTVKKSLKTLSDKSFWMKDDEGRDVLIRWINKPIIDNKQGTITVKLDDDVQKYLLDQHGNFTKYYLLYTLPMKSAYSFKMYELMQSYKFTGSQVFEIEFIKEYLGVLYNDEKTKTTLDKYKNFKDFRLKVLEIATKEINMYTDLDVSWTPIKTGRRVSHLSFVIKEKEIGDRMAAGRLTTQILDRQITIDEYLESLINV